MQRSPKRWWLGGFIFLAAFGLSALVTNDALAYRAQWNFYTNQLTVGDYTVTYRSAISNAVNDYHSNTDLSLYWALPPVAPDISHYETNLGATPWLAGTFASSYGTACQDWPNLTFNGYCNTSTHKVNNAAIYWNSYFWYSLSNTNLQNKIARHEMGHAFGLKHVGGLSCTTASVMSEDLCPVYTTLQTDDKNGINFLY